MSETNIVNRYLRSIERLNEIGFQLEAGRNFVIKNLNNSTLSKDSIITEFETIDEVSAWVSGILMGRFYEANKVFDAPDVKEK